MTKTSKKDTASLTARSQAASLTAPAPAETPSATDLMAMVENGETTKAVASVQALNQRDFVRVWRVVQTLEKALTQYALSWQGAEYWGEGGKWPDEQKAKAKATGS